MGGLTIDGMVNGKAEFNAGIEKDFSIDSIGLGEGFPERKEECKKHTCEY